jgi:hypothetical protein
MFKKDKPFGKEEEYPAEHLTHVMEIVEVFGKDEVEKHYYLYKESTWSIYICIRN